MHTTWDIYFQKLPTIQQSNNPIIQQTNNPLSSGLALVVVEMCSSLVRRNPYFTRDCRTFPEGFSKKYKTNVVYTPYLFGFGAFAFGRKIEAHLNPLASNPFNLKRNKMYCYCINSKTGFDIQLEQSQRLF